MFNSDLTDLRVLWLQVGVYLGKRDFVDRVDCVDPVGEDSFIIPGQMSPAAADGHVLPLMFPNRWRHHH